MNAGYCCLKGKESNISLSIPISDRVLANEGDSRTINYGHRKAHQPIKGKGPLFIQNGGEMRNYFDMVTRRDDVAKIYSRQGDPSN